MAKYLTTLDIVDMLKPVIGKGSAYSLAKFMGVSNAAAQRWVNGTGTMDDDHGIKAATALGLSPEYVLACLARERAERQKNSVVQAIWERIANHLPQAALFVLSIGCIAAHAQSLV